MSRKARNLLLALLAVVSITLLFVAKPPLQGAHWDAPIYVQRGKIAAETPLAQSYSEHAREIAAALPDYKPGVVDTPYWGFIRFGHTLLLGTVTALAGSGLTALRLSAGLYTVMFACSVVGATLLAIRLIELFAPDLPASAVRKAAVLSAGLYVASDIARYLAGNLVAEIPAMLLLTVAALALVESTRSNRLTLAAISGMAAFGLFVTKMELTWGYIVFFVIYAFMFLRQAALRAQWRAFGVAAVAALALYAAYAWWFYPLADPRQFLTFALADQARPPNPVAPIKLWFVAGGLLWVGLLLSLRRAHAQPAWWFAFVSADPGHRALLPPVAERWPCAGALLCSHHGAADGGVDVGLDKPASTRRADQQRCSGAAGTASGRRRIDRDFTEGVVSPSRRAAWWVAATVCQDLLESAALREARLSCSRNCKRQAAFSMA